jgi:threonyl-tRNA synthetase
MKPNPEEQKLDINVSRHSLAHIMALAVRRLYPDAKFGIGPVIDNGFYYDFDLSQKLNESDFEKIEKEMQKIIKENLPFTREEMSIGEAIKMFERMNQPYKVELLQDIWHKGTTIINESKQEEADFVTKGMVTLVSIYKTGEFTDLCRGPHFPNTGNLRNITFKLTKTAAAYWRGNEKNPQLQRIYAVAFSNPKELQDWIKFQEEVAKRDHREIGKRLDLFSFHHVAPGAPFWHPNGMIIIKELEKYWRDRHDSTGYSEISTPIMVKKDLWERSGHWQHYKDNMFTLEVDGEMYSLKPMNCPEATIVYSSSLRSYKDLPLRLSEIGRLHRNELSGTLGGLLRVRQITMDDAHIFCRPDQILAEITGVMKLVKDFYKMMGFTPNFYLSTKPDEAMGDPKLWAKAEQGLAEALKKNKLEYQTKPKDGAFYGPKIDIEIKDAINRSWQLATIQLDFQLPERFDLTYIDKDGSKQRPVMIHRAIFGSFERFLGIMLEHFEGNLPLWLAPVQIAIIPIAAAHKKYATDAFKKMQKLGMRVKLAEENEPLGKRIREAEMKKIPYILVVGDKEAKAKSFAVRKHGSKELKVVKVEKFLKQTADEIVKRK